MQKPVHTTARIVWRRDADAAGKYFELELLPAQVVPYLPGQYLNVVLDGQRRSYSMTNLPDQQEGRLRLLVERLPDGLASRFLDTAPVGSEVEIVLPFGRLTPQADKTRSHVLIATGSGIAPLRPIAEWLLEHTGGEHRVHLLWGVRYRETLFWLDWLEELAQRHPHFSYAITLTQPPEQWEGLRGRVTEHLRHMPIDQQSCYYLCGGKAMIDDVRALLKERGVPPANILTEQFHV